MTKKQAEQEPEQEIQTVHVVEERRLQPRGSGFSLFDPTRWAVLKEQCGMLLKSGFFPAHFRTVEQVVAVAMMARDLGIPLTTALQDIFIEEKSRKPSTSTKLLIALVKRHPDYQWHSFEGSDDTKGVFTLKVRGNPKPEVYTFTEEHARAQDLLTKFNWKKLKPIMLKWRAASMGIREQVPDIWLGYTHEELGAAVDIDQDGDIIVHSEVAEVKDDGAASVSTSAGSVHTPPGPSPESSPPPPPQPEPKYKAKWGQKPDYTKAATQEELAKLESDKLAYELKKISDILKDSCWKEVDILAMNKALPKFDKHSEHAKKFYDNLTKTLYERECDCDMPWKRPQEAEAKP
jgi:hypothetical protein